jgi:ketosteroid isomerase-like protein
MQKLRRTLTAAILLAGSMLIAPPITHAQARPPARQAATPEPPTAPVHEGLTVSDPLYQTISALDTKLFTAYNTCDLTTVSNLVDENLEFYHDKTGLTVGRQPLLDALKQNICGKVKRELVGTIEVYPLANYGAVEIGIHRFRHTGDSDTGEARFIHIWHQQGETWTITRVISFDHGFAK